MIGRSPCNGRDDMRALLRRAYTYVGVPVCPESIISLAWL